MTMTPILRKFALTVHLTSSVGWIGAVAAYLVLDITVATNQDAQALRAAWMAMGIITGYVIVPFALTSLLTGLVMSLGTKWGLFQHYWVLISFALTIVAFIILLSETQLINRMADIAADPTMSLDSLRALPNTLLHSVGGTLVLLVTQVLNVYKPRGLTPYGWRKQHEQRLIRQSIDAEA